MINRAKHRYIAFALFTVALILFGLSFIESHIEHNKNNWYVSIDKPNAFRSYTLEPNVPYAIISDDNFASMSLAVEDERGFPITKCQWTFTDTDILGGSPGPVAYHKFSITCKDTTILTLQVYLSGWFIKDAYYEIHKDMELKRAYYFDGEKLTYK